MSNILTSNLPIGIVNQHLFIELEKPEPDMALLEMIVQNYDINEFSHQGYHPLHFVKSLPVATLFCNYGANLNYQADGDGKTPLHLITNLEVISYLIEKGANVNLQDKNGNTPLHYELLKPKEDLEKIKLLVKAKPDFSLKNLENQLTLHLCKSIEVDNLFIENGAYSL